MLSQVCPTDCNDLKPLMTKLRRFYMAQRELSTALLQAKPLGICKTTISGLTKSEWKSLDSILKSGNATIRLATILSKGSSREMS